MNIHPMTLVISRHLTRLIMQRIDDYFVGSKLQEKVYEKQD